jgi:hypothetical protein
MAWRELKIAGECIAALALFGLWVPWGTLIRWVKEEVYKPIRKDVV